MADNPKENSQGPINGLVMSLVLYTSLKTTIRHAYLLTLVISILCVNNSLFASVNPIEEQAQAEVISGFNEQVNNNSIYSVEPKLGHSFTVGWMSSIELWLSISVLVFGLIIIVIETQILQRTSFTANQATKLITVTIIVIATLFIITAGFDSEQIAPAMGFRGQYTYLLLSE